MKTIKAKCQPVDYSFLEQFSAFLYKQESTPAKPELFLTIDGARISTLGNLLVISGPPKSGKTSVSAALIAGSLVSGVSIDTLGLEVHANPNDGEVIYINTELGSYDFQSLIGKILSRAGLTAKPTFFHALNLTGLNPKELLRLTEDFLVQTSRVRKIRLLVIDGVGEYVYSVNEPEACNKITQFFLKVAKDFNAAVVLIIHKNPGNVDPKSRGHLGSELSRKCESTLDLKPTSNCVILSGKDTRNAASGFTPRVITFDANKGYFISGVTYATIKKSIQKNNEEANIAKLKLVFEGYDNLKYMQLVQRMIPVFNIENRMAKKRIKDFHEKGFIQKEPTGEYALVK